MIGTIAEPPEDLCLELEQPRPRLLDLPRCLGPGAPTPQPVPELAANPGDELEAGVVSERGRMWVTVRGRALELAAEPCPDPGLSLPSRRAGGAP